MGNGEQGRLMKIEWPYFSLKDKIRDVCFLSRKTMDFENYSEQMIKGQEDRRKYLEYSENISWEHEFINNDFADDDSTSEELRKVSFKLVKLQKPIETLWRYYKTEKINKLVADILTPDTAIQFIDTRNKLQDHIRNHGVLYKLKLEFEKFDQDFSPADDLLEGWLSVDSTLHPDKTDRINIRSRKMAVYKYSRIVDFFLSRYQQVIEDHKGIFDMAWDCIEEYDYSRGSHAVNSKKGIKPDFQTLKDHFMRVRVKK